MIDQVGLKAKIASVNDEEAHLVAGGGIVSLPILGTTRPLPFVVGGDGARP